MKRTRQLFACAMLLATTLHGQTFEWAKESGNAYMSVIVDNSGHIVASRSNNTIECSNEKGDTLWTRSYAGQSYPTGITQDSHGNYYLTGTFSGTLHFGDKEITSISDYDIFIAKLDAATKSFSWAKHFGATDISSGTALVSDNNGHIYFCGSYAGDCDFDGTMLHSAGDRDIVAAELDGDGKVIWAKSFGGSGYDAVVGMVRNGNDMALTGTFSSSAKFDNTQLSGQTYTSSFICSLSSAGDVNWAKGYDYCRIQGLACDAGDILITGSFSGNVDFGSGKMITTTNTLGDVFLARLNSQGAPQWAVQSKGSYVNGGQGIAIDDQSNCYLTGSFSNDIHFGDFDATSNGEQDGFVIKYNADGEPQWIKSYGGEGEDGGSRLLLKPDKSGVILCGYIQDGPVKMDDITLRGSFGGSYFLSNIVLGTSGIAPASQEGSAFKIYPNPSSGHVNLQWEQPFSQVINIQLTDISGRLVFQKRLTAGEDKLQINDLTPGIYMIQTDKASSAQKLIVY